MKTVSAGLLLGVLMKDMVRRKGRRARQQQRAGGGGGRGLCTALTTGGERVLKHLIELRQVHHHGQLVWLPHRCHVFASHDGRNTQFLLSNIKGQLVILLHVLLIQRIKISEKQDEDNGSQWVLVPTPENTASQSHHHFLVF